MDTFERAFSDTEKAADSTLNAVKGMEKLAKTLQKAAKEGNISAIKKACSNLKGTLGSLSQTVANALETWPFKDEEEEAYLGDHYTKELRHAAKEKGLTIHEKDGALIAYPSIVHILPGDRAVMIDRKKVAALRPSRLAEMLVQQQGKKSRFRADAFLKSLYEMYMLLAKTQSSKLPGSHGPVVPLARIYEAFTSLPGAGREYSKIDFTRDIYLLETSGTLATKSGARVSFPSSTGTKRAKDIFQFVGPDGQTATYYGIQFSRGR